MTEQRLSRGPWSQFLCLQIELLLRQLAAPSDCTAASPRFSDYIIKEKSVLLQKKDSEGFGFVLRGAKAQTPIEEFTPTPAFPALQYLESVDEGGVAWRAGLRMGDFLIEVIYRGTMEKKSLTDSLEFSELIQK
ncbi:SH3 and multiple ankyrin repeat domains protein 1 [Liparis tanakae]|uniref:SH3 and multiple ankyrin repeat domains protein 1 n=1 Tax=Liparis tanakae TaxID=230148 RepID=A0A4Z2E215_9TELE|nr:SH3 and multiple ankyrin repeat domains protein 1 [Liparis tanakae]